MKTARIAAVTMALCSMACGGATPALQTATPHIEADSGGPTHVTHSAPQPEPEAAPPEPEAAEPVVVVPVGPPPSLAHWDPDAPIVLLPEVEANVRAIVARGPERRADVFAKIGDSATASRTFMRCFADDDELDLAGRSELQPVIDRIRAARVGGRSSFSRESGAAVVGRSVHTLLRGNPSPIVAEVRALSPRFALVMFGGNDVEIGRLDLFAVSMLQLIDLLTERGIVPILSTTPMRDDDAESNAQVPRYDAVIEAVARARRIPLLDVHRALRDLPAHGLASDGVHPNAPVVDGRAHACRFDEAGMNYGMNVRNLLNLRMLAHLAEVIGRDDAAAGSSAGSAEAQHPTRYQVEGARFAMVGSTLGGATANDAYAGCGETDESGPERRFALHVDAATTVRAEVMYTGDVDVDVHLLRDGTCVARGDRILSAPVEPGEYEVVVDTFESERHAGEFMLLVER